MPASPDTAARLAYEAVEIVAGAEVAVLRAVARRLREGRDAAGWQTAKLSQLALLRAEVARDLAALDADLARVVNATISRAYSLGQALAVGDLDDLGIAPRLPDAQWAAVTRIAHDVSSTVTGLTPVVLRTVADVYQQAVAAELGSVLLGARTRRQTAQQVLNRLLGDGVGGFRDRAGRAWRLESYVEMAVRTGAGQAMVDGHVQTLVASGQDLVQIIPGPRPCPSCDVWAGAILSLTGAGLDSVGPGGRVPVAGTLDEVRGSGHLFGPNCRCSTGIYVPGVSSTGVQRPDPAGYVAQQEQRALERGIREAKRREALALDDGARVAAGRLVRERQASLRAHLVAHPELKRQRGREQIGRAI
ncbi:phage minor capsid protein [Sanguibacter sp. HDW7]|uniref:phage minor capsid protein n=1 Tax=Sanguibacter sp. HDW7 TaxID=2714931 RepID=UPI0014096E2D|nr:phage minor capsid protein [Sanguibacter sp. HDW7]QIK82995.1 hypothetical protein G7063_04650 [Sanguibacter sp. HDW7]